MAKFNLQKRQKRKRRVVHRKRKSTNKNPQQIEQRQSFNLDLIPLHHELPPDEVIQVLVYDTYVGWYTSIGAIVCQHYHADMQMFGYSRARYWAFLEQSS